MREAVRNRLLRRVDWRFLLPNPRPSRVRCFVGGELRAAAALIADAVVDNGECDLAIAADPTVDQLRTAAAALRPGGWFYGEWHAHFASAATIERALQAAGYDTVRTYWPWPSLRDPRAWLPFDDDLPTAYCFLRHRRLPGQIQPLLFGLGRYAAVTFRRFARLRTPLCVLARKPGGEADADELRGGPTAPGWRWVLLSRGPRSISKVIGLAFPEGARTPHLVAKIARVPEATAALAREAEALQAVAGTVGGIPEVMQTRMTGDVLTVVEAPVAGAPLWSVLRRDTYRPLALQATEWLAALATARRSAPSPVQERIVQPALERFVSMFGPILLPAQVRVTRELLATLGEFPQVPEQRDFSPWNVFVTPAGSLAVLDWESAEPRGLPALDLIYFLTYLTFFRDRAMRSRRFLRSYRAMLDPSTFTGAVHRECWARYCAATAFDPGYLPAFRVLTWVLHAASEYRQFHADADAPPAPEALRQSLFVQLWEEELRRLGEVARTP